MECDAKEDSEKKIRRKRPTPPLPFVVFFFCSHISLHCPHDLNAWNRLRYVRHETYAVGDNLLLRMEGIRGGKCSEAYR